MTVSNPSPGGEPLIHVEEEEVVVEHHPEDWLAIAVFWVLAFIVFLQFFTRYVLNDSLAWTEEIARYALIWVVFVGAAMVTRRNSHIAVELLSNLLPQSAARTVLLAFIDTVKLLFMGLLAYFSLTIVERMHYQRMTVFDLPMSLVYAGVVLGCVLDVCTTDSEFLAQCPRRLALAVAYRRSRPGRVGGRPAP